MNQRITLAVLVAALMLCLAIPQAAAQLITGNVQGIVHDPQGAVIPGATVTLTSETKGTSLPNVVTGSSGDFLFAGVPTDTYSLQVSFKGFKTLKRNGISVSAGDRIGLGVIKLEVGGTSETVTVTAQTVQLQTQSAERSFTITTEAVANLPVSGRSFLNFASLTPGVTAGSYPGRTGDRYSTGSNSDTNVMMDGVSTMDTGSNSPLLQMNQDSIDEVKVLVSNYQAEYGRSSGIQISGVTKSGTNGFHGSAYMLMRRTGWNEWSKTAKLNGDTRGTTNEKDLGYTIGGPIGKPGKNNKLFFFYSHEYAPGSTGGATVRYRFPTVAERAGDFSQTTDNNGNLYPYIKDPLITGTCSASNQTACFKDNGVLGKIPANRLYPLGVKILSLYPTPTLTATAGQAYNWEGTTREQSAMAMQPVIKIDYSPWQKLRGSFKYGAWTQAYNKNLGNIEMLDSRQYRMPVIVLSANINYGINNSTFLEGTLGRSRNDLTGCAQAQQNTRPLFCANGLPTSDLASLDKSGLGALPLIYPDAGVINKDYYAFTALEAVKPPIWDGTRLRMVPGFSWGGRVSSGPPSFPFPGWFNVNITWDASSSITKVLGRHTMKAGFYYTHSYKAQQRQGWAGTIDFSNSTSNPLDSGFGFSNAILGVFTSYNQYSKYIEGNFVYNNTEFFLQDNWKFNDRITLDYGLRFVHVQPQYDKLGQGVNFLFDQWKASDAPYIYLAGCPGGATTCSSTARQAKDPRTGALMGTTSTVAIGTLVPNSGNAINGLFLSGQGGVPATTYNWPALRVGPRFGIAYDVTGKQKLVLRGGGGLMFDRTSGNAVFNQVQNPPTLLNVTMRYANLQNMSGALTTQSAPSLNVYQLESGLPSTWTWNGGVQYMAPRNTVISVEYVGQYTFNRVEGVGINETDLGAAFLAQNQDPTLTSTIPGSNQLPIDSLRPMRGFGSITMNMPRGWDYAHSLQLSVTRRFSKGLAFGFNDTIMLKNIGSSGARLQHNPDGTWLERPDQGLADDLLNNYIGTRHTFKANFIYDLPGLKGNSLWQKVAKWPLNEWRISGIWTANTPSSYTVGYSFQNGASNSTNITGSSAYSGRVRILGDPGGGCNADDAYRQFNTSAFAPALQGSVGLDSPGGGYMRGCFNHSLDLALARTINLGKFHLGEGRRIELRVDAFNALNLSRITGRNTTMQVTSTTDATIQNLPFDASGNLIVSRSLPKNAGFGVANGYQGARNLQAQLRFYF
jgi:hypothetical protein